MSYILIYEQYSLYSIFFFWLTRKMWNYLESSDTKHLWKEKLKISNNMVILFRLPLAVSACHNYKHSFSGRKTEADQMLCTVSWSLTLSPKAAAHANPQLPTQSGCLLIMGLVWGLLFTSNLAQGHLLAGPSSEGMMKRLNRIYDRCMLLYDIP